MMVATLQHPSYVEAGYYGSEAGREFVCVTLSAEAGEMTVFLSPDEARRIGGLISRSVDSAIETKSARVIYPLGEMAGE
jgi:hypothetical protein